MSDAAAGDEFTGATLSEARAWLRLRLKEGVRCPCCTQFAKIYRRQITTSSARALIRLWRIGGQDYAHWPTLVAEAGLPGRGDETKLVHWGLVEEENAEREDGGRAGYWRVTELGVAWLLERHKVPRYARIYDSRCLGTFGPEWGVADALGKRFDLQELMNA